MSMVIRIGSLATISCEPRQARKGATVVVDSQTAQIVKNLYLNEYS